jgi:hypothetical protein
VQVFVWVLAGGVPKLGKDVRTHPPPRKRYGLGIGQAGRRAFMNERHIREDHAWYSAQRTTQSCKCKHATERHLQQDQIARTRAYGTCVGYTGLFGLLHCPTVTLKAPGRAHQLIQFIVRSASCRIRPHHLFA